MQPDSRIANDNEDRYAEAKAEGRRAAEATDAALQETLRDRLNTLNAIRKIQGLPPVSYDDFTAQLAERLKGLVPTQPSRFQAAFD